jgi:hypothetical protein
VHTRACCLLLTRSCPKVLFDLGGDPRVENKEGKSCWDVASTRTLQKNQEQVRQLIEAKLMEVSERAEDEGAQPSRGLAGAPKPPPSRSWSCWVGC